MTAVPAGPAPLSAHWPTVGVIACAIGGLAVAAPSVLSRAYGLPPPGGGPALAWRLFGVRTAMIGAAVLRADPSARRAVVPVQLADQAVFAHALLSGTVPRRTALLAIATSGVLVALARPAPASGGYSFSSGA